MIKRRLITALLLFVMAMVSIPCIGDLTGGTFGTYEAEAATAYKKLRWESGDKQWKKSGQYYFKYASGDIWYTKETGSAAKKVPFKGKVTKIKTLGKRVTEAKFIGKKVYFSNISHITGTKSRVSICSCNLNGTRKKTIASFKITHDKGTGDSIAIDSLTSKYCKGDCWKSDEYKEFRYTFKTRALKWLN